MKNHPLLRGNPKPITLQDSYKTFTRDQDKVITPAETIRRFKERLAAARLDILREVRRIDNGRLDIPIYFSMCGKDAQAIIGNKKQMGKGSSPEQSQASACMELAERYSFFSFVKDPANFITATHGELKKLDLPLLPLERLLQSVHDTSTTVATLERMLANIPIQWTWATNLTRGEEVLVPFSWFFAINEFNGPSAGNTCEEAVNQGISEIVERHVCALINRHHPKVPAIDLTTVQDPVARELLQKFTSNGIELYLNDFSLDTGIPTIGALAIDRSTFPAKSEIVYTAGTTPGAEKALIRAITEVAQLAGDFNSGSNYVASGLPKPLAMSEVAYITNPGVTVGMNELPDLSDANMKVEIERCVTALKKLNMEVLVINTMHADLQIPTLYTIIPGAHFRERSMIQNAGLFAAKLIAESDMAYEAINQHLVELHDIVPNAYYLEFYLGRNLLAMGRHDEALARFRQATTLHPEDEDMPYLHSYLGHCLKDMERYDEAIVELEKGLALDDERPDIHNALGVCHFKQQGYAAAIRHFQRAVELAPASAIDYANLGINYQKLGQNEAAVRNFEIALDLDPGIDWARTLLAELTASA